MEISHELRAFFELDGFVDLNELVERMNAYIEIHHLKKKNMIFPDEALKKLFHIETPFLSSKVSAILQRHIIHSEHCIYCNEHVSYKSAHHKTKKHLMYKEIYELKQRLKESESKLQNRNLIIEELHYEIESKGQCIRCWP